MSTLLDELKAIAENFFKPKSFCKHQEWRPAVTSKSGAKMCAGCAMVVPVSDAEFYSLFGEAKYRQYLGHR